MKARTKETLIDKLIDIIVVILGILIALSIDSYVETKKQEKQWKSFAKQFYVQAKEQEDEVKETIEFYQQRLGATKAMIKSIENSKKSVEGLDEFLNSLGSISLKATKI